MSVLVPTQIEEYHNERYLIVENLLTTEEADAFVNYEAT